MSWYIQALKKYAVFSGRARRKEFWYFVLVNNIIVSVLSIIDSLAGIAAGTGYSVLAGIYILAVLLPFIGVGIRRLHDTGRKGWWLFSALVPPFVAIPLIFWVRDSQEGTNQYGPLPKVAD